MKRDTESPRRLVWPLLACLAFGCAGTAPPGLPYDHLADCTDELSRFIFDQEPPAVPDPVRLEALTRASAWATENCFLPCPYEMCGTIVSYDRGQIRVYVSYRPEPGAITIGPEAELLFSLPSYQLVEETVYHAGCQWQSRRALDLRQRNHLRRAVRG